MSQLLANKTALVTGASKGIGRAAAVRLAKDGAFVFVNYASDEKGAAETVKLCGGKAVAVKGDLSTLAGIRAMFADVDAQLKGKTLDILVNNAGVYPMGTLEETTEEDFDKTFAVNVKGLFFTTQEAVKRMGKGGRIVNVSTTLTRIASNSMIAYAASKGAVNMMTRDFAAGLGAKGITVNAVAPGLIRTEGTAGMTAQKDLVDSISKQVALGRIGEADEVADAIAFLAGPDSRWVTAQTIETSGGYKL